MIEAMVTFEAIEILGAMSPLMRGGAEPRESLDVRYAERGDAGLMVRIEGQWDELADHACDANVFFESWMLAPAIEHLARPGDGVELAAAWDAGRLAGVLPLARSASLPWSWAAVRSVWPSRHCFDTTPLVRSGAEAEFLESILGDLSRRGVGVLRWRRLPTDTRFAAHLFDFLDKTGRRWVTTRQACRPMLRAGTADRDRALDGILSRNRRRGLHRRMRRLSEMGDVKIRVFDAADDPAWCARFLALEARGWKGDAGTATAFDCREAERRFFEAVSRGGAGRGRILIHSLELDGAAIAMTVNYRARDGMWAFKIAYDEAYRSLAPGVLIEVEGTRAAVADPSIRWVDSCADDDNDLMSELWPDGRPMADLLIATAPGPARMLDWVAWGDALHGRVRATGKRLYQALRKGGRRTTPMPTI